MEFSITFKDDDKNPGVLNGKLEIIFGLNKIEAMAALQSLEAANIVSRVVNAVKSAIDEGSKKAE